jgi:hypothetical protein
MTRSSSGFSELTDSRPRTSRSGHCPCRGTHQDFLHRIGRSSRIELPGRRTMDRQSPRGRAPGHPTIRPAWRALRSGDSSLDWSSAAPSWPTCDGGRSSRGWRRLRQRVGLDCPEAPTAQRVEHMRLGRTGAPRVRPRVDPWKRSASRPTPARPPAPSRVAVRVFPEPCVDDAERPSCAQCDHVAGRSLPSGAAALTSGADDVRRHGRRRCCCRRDDGGNDRCDECCLSFAPPS